MKIKEASLGFRKVFSNWRYISSTALIAFAFYWIYLFLINYRQISLIYQYRGFFQAIFISPFMRGFIPKEVIIGTAIISLLFGILFSLIIYKSKMIKNISKKTGLLASVGIFLGFIAPAGCSASCGIGILSIVGISTAAINFLPLKGMEITIVSACILSLSIYKVSKDINKGILCEIKLPTGKS